MTDPINHSTREPHQPNHAIVVEGTLPAFENGEMNGEIDYQVRLDRLGPGNVEFKLILDGKPCGTLPFDNLVKAATRIDPEHAVGSEKQIADLRRELSEARATMYDWQAKAEKLEIKAAQLDAEVTRLEAKIRAYEESTKA